MDIPHFVGKNGKRLVIVNLQSTPLDKGQLTHSSLLNFSLDLFNELVTFSLPACFFQLTRVLQFALGAVAFRINAKCDDFMALVMKKLGYEVPQFRLTRRINVTTEPKHTDKDGAHGDGDFKLTVQVCATRALRLLRLSVCEQGVDVDGTPATILKKFTITQSAASSCALLSLLLRSLLLLRSDKKDSSASAAAVLNIKLEFFGHYNEPSVTVSAINALHLHLTLFGVICSSRTRWWLTSLTARSTKSCTTHSTVRALIRCSSFLLGLMFDLALFLNGVQACCSFHL